MRLHCIRQLQEPPKWREKDKCADMIVTEENPLDDLRALRHVKMVVARGTITENPKVKINKRVETELDKFL